jgi:hypothetical protein
MKEFKKSFVQGNIMVFEKCEKAFLNSSALNEYFNKDVIGETATCDN